MTEGAPKAANSESVPAPGGDDRRLVDFLGYGPDPSSVELLLFGQEERCPREVIDLNLEERRRVTFPTDKNAACRTLAAACQRAGYEDAARGYLAALDPRDPRSPPQWRFAAMFAQQFFGTGDWIDEYAVLGTSSGKTLLAERFPLPRPWNGHRFRDLDEKRLTRDHIAVLQDRVIAHLRRGTVVVSYAGGPTDLLGAMIKAKNRAWATVAGSGRGEKDRVLVAQPQQHPLVVMQVPTLRHGDEEWWAKWMPAAVREVKAIASRLADPGSRDGTAGESLPIEPE